MKREIDYLTRSNKLRGRTLTDANGERLEATKSSISTSNPSQLNRREVLQRGIALGLTAPVIASLLAACGGDEDEDSSNPLPEQDGEASEETAAEADVTEAEDTEAGSEATETQSAESATETEQTSTDAAGTSTEGSEATGGGRGGDGELRLLWWQAPTILNTHYSAGTKDNDASRPILEPLVEALDDGSLYPVLAAEVPSYENGGLSEDGQSMTIKLREGVKWHDGEDFDADDVKFTYDWVMSEGNVPTTIDSYSQVENVEVVDSHTVKVTFDSVNTAWMRSPLERILPEHIMKEYMGDKGPDAPFNLSPIGTGPYKLMDFKPGDVVRYELFEDYWDPGKPHFDTVTMKGGGTAVSAARAALQTGNVDYSWNLQVEARVLEQLSGGDGPGELLTPDGLGIERIQLQFADPRKEVDGAFAEPSTEHPWQSDPAVREAYKLLCDREAIAEQLYGPGGNATALWIPGPEKFLSPNGSFEFNPEKAAQSLDDAGWVLEGDVRTKDGVKIGILIQASINNIRQKEQEIIKQAFESVGMPVEIKAVDASVFYSADAGNPNNRTHFYADLQLSTFPPTVPFPTGICRTMSSLNPERDLAQKSNSWSGVNVCRWVNEEFNQAYEQVLTELDEDKQIELFVKMNDIIVEDGANIPLVLRTDVAAKAQTLDSGQHSRWSSSLYNVAEWKRVEG